MLVVVTSAVSYSSRAEATPESTTAAEGESTSTTMDPAASLVSAGYTAELKGGSSGPGYVDPRAQRSEGE